MHPARQFIRYIDSIQEVKNLPILFQFDLSFIFIQFSNISNIIFQFHMHFLNIISKICSFYIIISDLFSKLPKHWKEGIEVGRTNMKKYLHFDSNPRNLNLSLAFPPR